MSVCLFICGNRLDDKISYLFNVLKKYPIINSALKLGWSNNEEVKTSISCTLSEDKPFSIFLFKFFDEDKSEYVETYDEKRLDRWMDTYLSLSIKDLCNEEIQKMYQFRNYLIALIYLYEHDSISQALEIPELSMTYMPFYHLSIKYRVNIKKITLITNRVKFCFYKGMLIMILLEKHYKCFLLNQVSFRK